MRQSLLILIACLSQAATGERAHGPDWLSDAIIYQIFPSSFMDSDDDGIGDINGIISQLDYVQRLGANTIGLCPVFCSAWQNGGYDVTDFYHVDPRFGNDVDMERLIHEAHEHGLRVCLDLVAEHTSDQHPWFKSSGQQGHNPYTDYYVWSDTVPGNEWVILERRHRTNEPEIATWGNYGLTDAPRAHFYRKTLYECQPSLNYGFANVDPSDPSQQSIDAPGPKAVLQELLDIMDYWLNKGIDGYRVDLSQALIKNDPDQRENIKLWRQICQWLKAKYPRCILIAEWCQPEQSLEAGFDIDYMMHYGLLGYDALFFPKESPDSGIYDYCYFDASGLGDASPFLENYNKAYLSTRDKGYITIPTSHHDMIRSNYGSRNTIEQLKVKMLFHLTMPGVPCIYYGDEIGLKYQPDLPDKEGARHGTGSRTPMQWSNSWNAGFSSCDPRLLYLPIDSEHGAITVEEQEKDQNSMLHFTRSLLKLRRENPALGNDGSWKVVSDPSIPYPMIYQREKDGQHLVVAINPSGKKVSVTITHQGISGKALISVGDAHYKSIGEGDKVTLQPFSAAVFQ